MSYNPVLPAGQAPMANSEPVVIASDQSPIPVVGSISIDTSLLAKEAKQDSEITQLTSILAKIIAAPATESTLNAIETILSGIDFATQDTLAAILSKIIAAPATEAKQDTGNSSLSTIAGKDFATQTTLAALLSANHTDLAAILTKLNGTIVVNTGLTQPLTDAQLRATPVPISGTVTVTGGGDASAAKQDIGNASLSSIDTKLTNPLPISGTVAVSNFPATAIADGANVVEGSTTDAAVSTDTTGTISGKLRGLVKLLSAWIGSLGQKTMANSAPVVIASDQTAVPISAASLPLPSGAATAAGQTQPGIDIGDVTINNASGGSAVNIQDGGNSITVDGSITANAGTNLNTSLLALESGGNLDSIKNSLLAIDGGIPTALGQTTMSASMPVTIASDQSAIPITFSGSPAIDNTLLYSDTLSATGAITGIDTTGYASITAQLSGRWTGNAIFEGSNDNSIWDKLFILNVNELSMQDSIYQDGSFQIKTSTKYIRFNLVGINTGSVLVTILGRTVSGILGADLLSFAMDRGNNTPLYVEETATKKDISKALIPSDAPAPIYGTSPGPTGAVLCTIDTTGYQSVTVQIFGTWTGTLAFQTSNDGSIYTNTIAYIGTQAAIGAATVANTNGLYVIPVTGRFLRPVWSNFASGTAQVICFLRQIPVSNAVSNQNLAFINGTAPVTAGLAGMLAVGGTTSVGATPGSINPVVVGGIDTGGLIRRFRTDTSGDIIGAGVDSTATARPIGVLAAAANTFGVSSQIVTESSLYEGQSTIEILAQILLELKINNQLLSELPIVLKTPTDILPDPSVFRNEPSFFN